MAAPVSGWAHKSSPFHEGEQTVQTRVGVRDKQEATGRRVIRDFLPEQHREFYGLLPFLIVGTVDEKKQPWCSVVTGAPGFITSPDTRTLRFETTILAGDPLAANLRVGVDVGLVGVQLSTRRRNRVSGTISAVDPSGFAVHVKQTVGNCPQYIQIRSFDPAALPAPTQPKVHAPSTELNERAKAIITASDTFFIATAHIKPDTLETGCDASHRGGKPGFVRINDARTLSVPDFVGNFMFNTLGNLLLNPVAGLIFLDFPSRDLLYLACDAEIVWDGEEVKAFAAAERLVRFKIRSAILVERSLPLQFSGPDFSPILDRTGSWESAEAALEAARTRNVYRPYRVAKLVDESELVRSIYLEPADDKGVIAHTAGQFLPIRMQLAGAKETITRTYTLSDAANGRHYRLSIKKEGAASEHLHSLKPGDFIEAVAPRGDFVFDSTSSRPVVMIAAGIGITPLLAMLNDLLVNEGRTRHHNRIVFIHSVRNSTAHPFRDHLKMKASKHSNLTLHVRYTAPLPEDKLSTTHDGTGRIDKATLQQLLPLDDYDFYLCGPGTFMQAIYDVIKSLGVPDARIRFEAFGPASVKRARAATVTAPTAAAGVADIEEAVEVLFAKSNRIARWKPQDGTLLELAEAQGLEPAFSCRNGACGTCAVKVIKGRVVYQQEPIATFGASEALICCSVPRPGDHKEGSQDREGVVLDL